LGSFERGEVPNKDPMKKSNFSVAQIVMI